MITEQNRYKAGGSYYKYSYTTRDIARITGRAIGTIRNDVASGKIVIDDLASVAQYIVRFLQQ